MKGPSVVAFIAWETKGAFQGRAWRSLEGLQIRTAFGSDGEVKRSEPAKLSTIVSEKGSLLEA